MANHALPTTTDLYANVLTYLHARIDDASKLYDSSLTYSNPPAGVVRWNSTSLLFEKNTGSPAAPTWTALTTAYNININGTVGATTANTGAFTTLSTTGVASLAANSTVGSNAIVHVGNAAQSLTGQITFSNATAPIIAAKVGPSSTQQHVLPVVTSDTIALLTASQTFTNKTYSSGAKTGTFSGDHTLSGQVSFTNATAPIIVAKIGPSSTQQHTLPVVSSDTIALLTATQTLTNKTLTGSAFNGTVGATTPAAGAFTTISSTSAYTIAANNVPINFYDSTNVARRAILWSGNTIYYGDIDNAAAASSLYLNAINGGTLNANGVQKISWASGGVTITNGNLYVGNGTGTPLVVANGANTGAAAGGALFAQNGGVTVAALGGYSSMMGGAYDATATVYANSSLRLMANGSVYATLSTTGLAVTGSIYSSNVAAFSAASGSNALRVGVGVDLATTVGQGLEVRYTTGTSELLLLSYDRTTPGYKNMAYDANVHQWRIGGTNTLTLDGSGYLVLGDNNTNARFKAALTGASTTSITTVSDFGAAGVLSLGGISSNSQGVYLGTGDARTGLNSGIATGIGFLREAVGWNSALAFYTNGTTDSVTTNRITERARIDSAGNFGLGVIPAAWSLTGLAALQIKNAGIYGNGTSEVGIMSNAYYNTSWKYIASDFAAQYVQSSGNHHWYTAASGTANAAIGFGTSKMTLSNSGTLILGNTTSTAPALIDLQSTTKGFKFPVMTTAQKNAITATAGLVVFDSNLNKLSASNGTAWGSVGGGATGGGTDDIFYENGQTVTTNYTLTTGKNAMSAGPITINTGITVTIPTGASWSIV